MKSTAIVISHSFLLTFMALAFLMLGCSSVHAIATVSVFPSSITADVGQSFSVDLTISGVSSLYGWEFELNWSATLLDAVNVVEGPFLKNGGATFFAASWNNTQGHMVADCTLLGEVPGVSGNGVLASVTFSVRNGGATQLDLHDMVLLDSLETPIPCQDTDGYWSSPSQHDVAVSNINVFPTVILSGENVSINVTASNEGDFAETFNVTAFADGQNIGIKSVSLNASDSVTIPFVWVTTGFGKGDYLISASASIVPGETDTADNLKVSDTQVTLLAVGHDVAVISLESTQTIVGQGFCMNATVTVKDYGTFNETFDTDLYVNATLIEMKPVNVGVGQAAILVFTWNTTGFARDNYSLSVYAEPVPGEANTTDNSVTINGIAVSMKGDISSQIPRVPDGKVDMSDVAAAARAFGTFPGYGRWYANADLSGIVLGLPDGIVNMRDISVVAKYFGAGVS